MCSSLHRRALDPAQGDAGPVPHSQHASAVVAIVMADAMACQDITLDLHRVGKPSESSPCTVDAQLHRRLHRSNRAFRTTDLDPSAGHDRALHATARAVLAELTPASPSPSPKGQSRSAAKGSTRTGPDLEGLPEPQANQGSCAYDRAPSAIGGDAKIGEPKMNLKGARGRRTDAALCSGGLASDLLLLVAASGVSTESACMSRAPGMRAGHHRAWRTAAVPRQGHGEGAVAVAG